MEVKIKKYPLISRAERENIDYMAKMEELYKLNVENYDMNPDYVKISSQLTLLRNKDRAAKELELQKLKRIEVKNQSALNMQETIDKFNFYMTSTGTLTWYYQPEHVDEYGNRDWRSIKKETLQANFVCTNVHIRGRQGEEDYSSFKEFNKLLVDQGRTFTNVIQSYTRQTSNGKLNIMNKKFAEPNANGESDYHWMFDAIFESISGGSVEDKDTGHHLQEIIYAKYLHPDNIFLPAVMINDNGSSGKGLFGARFLQTLFAGNVADNCNIEHLTGKFNGAIAGKAVIFINETARDKVDVEKVKSFIGSPTFMVEEKFEKPYACDNTGLVISATNQSTGGITLSGENSDRRYSIFSTKSDIYEIVQKFFREKEQKKLSRDEVQDWIESEGQYLLSNKEQMGKWIWAMYLKHGDIEHVRANKGKAYQHLLDRQRGGWLKTVDDVFNEPGFTYIREQVLRDLIKEMNKSEKFLPGRNLMQEQIEKYIRDKGLGVRLVTRATIHPTVSTGLTIQRTIWTGIQGSTVTEDETKYGSVDQNGRWVWKWQG